MLLTFSFFKLTNFVLVISMVWITRIQEIKLRIAQFILTNSCFEFGTVPSDKTCGLVDNVLETVRKSVYLNCLTHCSKYKLTILSIKIDGKGLTRLPFKIFVLHCIHAGNCVYINSKMGMLLSQDNLGEANPGHFIKKNDFFIFFDSLRSHHKINFTKHALFIFSLID